MDNRLSNNIEIRPCVDADLDSCEFLFDLPELAAASGDKLPRSYLERFLDERYFLVAEEDSRIVGAVYGEPLKAGGAMLWTIAVDEAYRGRKVGSRLLEKFEENALADGRKWVILHASTKNPATVGFYRQHGYDIGNSYVECAKDI